MKPREIEREARFLRAKGAYGIRTPLQIGTFRGEVCTGVCTVCTRSGRNDTFFGANVYSMTVDERRDDPFCRFLDAAPPDDEPETDEERAAIAEVEADRAAGVATLPFEDVKRAHRGA
jgi:hypothetical protein